MKSSSPERRDWIRLSDALSSLRIVFPDRRMLGGHCQGSRQGAFLCSLGWTL